MSAQPAVLKGLRRSLAGAVEPELRDRLQTVIDRLERLYGCAPPKEMRLTRRQREDMRRRAFCRVPHRLTPDRFVP